jgi:hypothetical protein
MKLLTLILLTLFISCDNQVIISQEEYSKLKGLPETNLLVDGNKFKSHIGNDGHIYLKTHTYGNDIYLHSIECSKCKQIKDSTNEKNLTRLLDSLRPKL